MKSIIRLFRGVVIRGVVTVMAGMLWAVAGQVQAGTVGYWRFESGSVTSDSSGNALTLTPVSTGPVSYALPASGAGMYFPESLPQTGSINNYAVQGPGTNASFVGNYYTAVDNAAMAPATGITVEAYVNLAATDANAKLIATQGGNNTNGAWAFLITGEGSSRGSRNLLFQWTNTAGTWGTGLETIDSDLVLEVGHDYYVACAVNFSDTTTNGVVFYLQDLTAGTAMQVVTRTHANAGMYDSVVACSIGASVGGGMGWLGTIDEVRWSNLQLKQSQLLQTWSTAFNQTVGYWRFEPGSVTSDSSPNALALSVVSGGGYTGPVSCTLPSSGVGSTFAKTLPLTGAANVAGVKGPGTNGSFLSNYYSLTDSTALAISTGMTIEAYINLVATDNNAKVIATQGGNNANGGWAFLITAENSYRGARHLLFQWTNVAGAWGTGLLTLDSGVTLITGHDYYVAFALNLADTTANGAVFYVKDLTAGTPMQTVRMTHTLTTMYDSGLAFTIGSCPGGGMPWVGVIDEVRWSKVQLAPDQLLISKPPIFSLSFDGSLTASATGTGTPTSVLGSPSYGTGVKGQAATFTTSQIVRYASAGNLNKSRGSISIWVQAPNDGSGTTWNSFFREDGPSRSGTVIPAVGSNTIWAWVAGGYGLRLDMRDPVDCYSYASIGNWKKNEWHHVVMTWDCNRGTSTYVDGRQAGGRAFNWTPVTTYSGFYIGAQDSTGTNAWRAGLDELMIYDYELTPDEVSRDYMRYAKSVLQVKVADPFLTAGVAGKARVQFWNADTSTCTISGATYALKNSGGTTVQSGNLSTLTVAGRQAALTTVNLSSVGTGTYSFVVSFTDSGALRSVSTLITTVTSSETMATSSSLALVTQVNAATTAPLSMVGTATVVNSSLGNYREASTARHDRFVYNFNVTDIDQPHVAVITYPDDKPRTMEIILQDLNGNADYQAQTGVFTGDEYPVSNTMKEHRLTFWPHSANQSFIFMTAEAGCPAAVKDIKIYRQDQFAAQAATGAFSGTVPSRRVGFYYEDCVINQNFGTTSDLPGFSTATDRLFDYMLSFGQTALCYPVAWYNGPLYGTMVEPYQPDVGGDIGGDRPHPDGFPSYWLKRLNARGMKFSAGLHIHSLPSLTPYTITDNARVKAGEETAVNVRSDGTSKIGYFHGSDPNYNALDTHVLESVKAVANEIGDRYADEPAFTGLTFVMAQVKLFTFGSLKSGYNDCNLTRFQTDTGITIGGYVAGDPNRFVNSYNWLMANASAKEAWIAWRCQKLHDHYKAIADTLSAKRSDLKVTLDFFVSFGKYTTYSEYLANPGYALQAMREAGFDPTLYVNDTNIVTGYTLVQDDFRWSRSTDVNAYPNLSKNTDICRSMLLAPELVTSIAALARTEAIVFDRYWEDAIGNTSPLTFPGYTSAKECTWRVSTLNGNTYHSLESYVAALNNFDAQRITKGGFLIGTYGMESVLSTFGQAFQALPSVKFDDVAAATDPIRVRQKVVDGKNYFYVLNRLPQSASITVTMSSTGTIDEPPAGATYTSRNSLTVALEPYGLRVFRCTTATQTVSGAVTTVPQAWVNQLQTQLNSVKTMATQKGLTTTYATYLTLADQLWASQSYARLYLLLQERWVICIELAGGGTANYNNWANAYFPTDQATNLAVSGPSATPQHDGVPNLLKYLCHINPTIPMAAADRAAMPTVGLESSGETKYLTVTYRQNTQASGVVVTMQATDDLMVSWQTVTPDALENLAFDPETGDPIIRMKLDVTTSPQRFVRLNVTMT